MECPPAAAHKCVIEVESIHVQCSVFMICIFVYGHVNFNNTYLYRIEIVVCVVCVSVCDKKRKKKEEENDKTTKRIEL